MPSLLHLHDMFAEVWASRDKSKDHEQIAERMSLKEENKENIVEEEEMGPGPLLDHIEDFTHPENLFNKCRNFPSQANCRATQFMAEKMLSEGREQEAAKLFLLSQAVTFQHLVKIGRASCRERV